MGGQPNALPFTPMSQLAVTAIHNGETFTRTLPVHEAMEFVLIRNGVKLPPFRALPEPGDLVAGDCGPDCSGFLRTCPGIHELGIITSVIRCN